MIVSIDGPAASGKSTTASLLAKKLSFIHLNTGLLYRAVTYIYIENNLIDRSDICIDNFFILHSLKIKGKNFNQIFWNDKNITKYLINENINRYINIISNNTHIRKYLVRIQREFAIGKNIVCEGRDIGTVVFPNADYKFYLIADLKSRIDRRYREIKKNNINISRIGIKSNIIKRDYNDMNRSISPLTKAVDAIEIDTTLMSINEQVKYIYKKIK